MLDKPSVEPHDKIRVAGKPSMRILKSTGREGVAQGIVVQRRGRLLVLGVYAVGKQGQIGLVKVFLAL